MASGGRNPAFLCHATTVIEPDRPSSHRAFEPRPDPVDFDALVWYDGFMTEKLEGKVLEGKWKYHHYQDGQYMFENIYNGNTIALRLRQVKNILEGKDTIARIQCRKIWKEGKTTFKYGNNSVIRSYTYQMKKYRKSRSGT